MKLKNSIILSLIITCGFALWAAQSYRVNNNATVLINEHGVSKNVQNNSCGVDRFVPTNTATEWSNFRTNKPACMVLTDPAVDCTGTTIHGHDLPAGYTGQTYYFSHELCGNPTHTNCGGAPGSHTFTCTSNTWTVTENSYPDCVPSGFDCD